ncbi:hypothetical protein GCM10017559_21720 [Streptosporangium longisporum]|uniref:Uncharacterized protein n=1 Tax=Streptosporangium longisporum TaxID=46187 RepID=A0ABN3XVG4_9ACTN
MARKRKNHMIDMVSESLGSGSRGGKEKLSPAGSGTSHGDRGSGSLRDMRGMTSITPARSLRKGGRGPGVRSLFDA